MATLGASGTGGTRLDRFKASQRLRPCRHPEQPEVTTWLPCAPSALSRRGSCFAPCRFLVFQGQFMWFPAAVFSPLRLSLLMVSEPK